mmetsp:Transcript_105928/g.306375  ORF Transcript_105928/g.306375 Transcript_105928/m.306375 type:complete len:417 (+) Transcript_105928:21-1271(+)|eukprot:CAMPEP_0176034574 /NCGR_PEP_ID=MMETSP0120_2-20121206/17092_1 /TAXON_ID=160619 /ORGANISM="Kryptoperidinium foliaceum, Strain CCMP 1326" /LENGTH=416 /DNA_ID=CAMNT_0017367917 /DNA_START=21 /DNA_END=1271 /DNA_ORIENTATION=-
MGRIVGSSKTPCCTAKALSARAKGMARDPLVTDLRYFHPEVKSFEAVPAGSLTMVEKIAFGINGEVFRCRLAQRGQRSLQVAVKVLRTSALQRQCATERNERNVHLQLGRRRRPCVEDSLTEIGVLQYLSKQKDATEYLLRMLGVFQGGGHVWIMTEYAQGGDLFAEVSRSGCLPMPVAKRYSREMFHAVSYLHKHRIGHRDISLENMLLQGGSIRLMDFGMAAQTHTAEGTPLRYFRAVGKDFYRAPECYVPCAEVVEVEVPRDASPGSVVSVQVAETYYCEVLLPEGARAGARCSAQPYGYEVRPVDIFAAGMCMSIMVTGRPLWSKAILSDIRFAFSLQRDVVELQLAWGLPFPAPDLAALMMRTLSPSPHRRWSACQCLDCPWLADVDAESVAPPHLASISVDASLYLSAGA